MADAVPEFRPSPDSRELADALRSGLAVRRSRLDSDAQGADEARLRELGDLEGLPPVAKPGPAAPIVKILRQVLQVFLRPWLATQTIFNREIARRFQNIITSVRDLERRAPHLDNSLEHLTRRIQQLEEGREASDRSNHEARRSALTGRSLEGMFVHGRMPRPPARVLSLGDSGTAAAIELATFGFDVWAVRPGSIDPAHPKLRRCRSVLAALPFADATFDVVVSLSVTAGEPPARDETGTDMAVVSEVSRVLKPSGRYVVTMPILDDVGDLAAVVASMLAPLHVTEMLRAVREDGAWSVHAGAARLGPNDVTQHEAAIVLVVAERRERS